ncbi:major facilitator superfamily domain-containing protein [Suillus subluteus]|nr:major facilitator superfamily domain-containing protein [Suillus subluteus]
MIALQDDEETPLLQRPEQRMARTSPLPWDQFWIILFLQFSDSLVFQTLAPFTPQLIRDIGVTNGDESQVGHYVGILQSSYYTAQALTILHWSQLSDHIGRKPVILTALFAISISMFSFGLSKNFVHLVISRAFCGAFNGSNGVIKSMVMDITDTSNLPKAYGYMPAPMDVGDLSWTTRWWIALQTSGQIP